MAQNSQASAKKKRPRGRGRPFTPGQSGNPGGRPKENHEVVELARTYTKQAVERLAFWMASDNAKASVTASVSILDRAWGKASQSVDVGAKESLATLLLAVMKGRA